MRNQNTKEKILDAALELFSVDGFDGVSVKQISEKVGIRDSSLYKHFRSKQAIFDTLMSEMNRRFEETVTMYNLPQGEIAEIAKEYGRNDLHWLKKACEAVFLFFLKEPRASKFRKLLMIEQYKNPAVAETFRSSFTDNAITFQTALFTEMIRQGYFQEGPPETIALQFYAPFYLLLCQYDTMPEREDEALAALMAHIEQFASVYQMRNEA